MGRDVNNADSGSRSGRLKAILGKVVDGLGTLTKTQRTSGAAGRSRAAGGRSRHRAADRDGIVVEYNPSLDGDADPGEVVWTWVTYEDDPSQGKDRPVVIIGRRGSGLVGVALTSKEHDNEPQVRVGAGRWDREGRPSFAKVDRLLDIRPNAVRREGAILDRAHFDAVVAGARTAHGGTLD